MELKIATLKDIDDILQLYKEVVLHVNNTDIKLGWDIEVYPNQEFVFNAINNHEMLVVSDSGSIIAAAVVNHTVNKEYDDIDWDITEPKEKVSTIHALAVSPGRRGKVVSDFFLKEIDKFCIKNGDVAIHLDVIDTNIPAYKLYLRNQYKEIACISMYYEVVGTREFWMLEKVLG